MGDGSTPAGPGGQSPAGSEGEAPEAGDMLNILIGEIDIGKKYRCFVFDWLLRLYFETKLLSRWGHAPMFPHGYTIGSEVE